MRKNMYKKLLSCFLLLGGLLIWGDGFSQKTMVTGRITDSLGTPIPNASVLVKNARTGTSSKEDGSFQIQVGPRATLVVSGLGFTPAEVAVGGQSNVTIVLSQSPQSLNEVVVTALGIQRSRNSLPYSTQQLAGDELNKTPTTNFVDNLSGKVSGLQITSSNTMGGSNNVILRGMKSLTGSNQALFVVDGVPYDNTNQSRSNYDIGNTISDINPDDIESVSVLKGAAASALYGSRAFNGVILITTKKGGKRRKGIGVTVDLGATIGSPDKSTLPVYQEEYGQGAGSAGNDPGNPNLPGFFYYKPTFNSNGQNVKIVQTDIDQATGPMYNPNLMVYNWDAFSPGNPNYGKATPWMPAAHNKVTDFMETPVTSTANIYMDGGGDNFSFKMGYTHSYDKGYLPNSHVGKDLLNFGATYNVTDRVSVGGQFNYSVINGLGRYGYGYSGINQMTDFRQWWQTNVDVLAQKADYFRTRSNASWNWQGGYTTNVPGNIVKPAYHDNIYWYRYQNFESDSRTRYFGNAHLDYKITDYLSFMARVAKDEYSEMVETRVNVGSSATSSYSRSNATFSETNYDALLNFNKDFGGKFNVKALLGTNIRTTVNQSISSATNGGLVVPGYFALGNSVNTPNAPSEGYSKKEVDGIFAGATITYKEMLTLDATLRRDRSSTLPKQNNAFYYPSISGNFVFSKLLPDATWLSYGKVLANYAQVGGDAPIYSLQNTYGNVTPFNGQTLFSSPTTNNNPSLVPEQNKTYEAGVELSFLRNRLGVNATIYNARAVNQIMPVSVSTASGYSTFYVNGGTVQNRGVELTINATPVKTIDFSWNININWSANRNKVLFLYNNQPSYTITKWQNSVQLVAEAGKSWGIIRGSDYTYVDGKRVVDANGHYVLNSNKLSDIGNINPDWIGGINNSFSYKNFALSFLVDMRQGGDVYSLDMDYGASSGILPLTAGKNDLGNPVRTPIASGGGIVLPAVTADGKANTKRIEAYDIRLGSAGYPFSSLFGEGASSYIYDASYIKLREVALSYSLPKKTLEKISFVKGLDFALTGKNLWIIHKNLPYSDPEQGVASGNTSMGFQSGAYPTFRTIGFNIKARF